MASPHFKNASNNVMLVWDDTAKDFVVWDGQVTGGSGFDTVWLKNVAGTKINPATEEKQDDIIDNQTSGSQKTKVVDSAGVVQEWTMPEGQEASANSMPMVLSTEQEAILSALLTSTIFTGRIGEVQTSPTANTVLDRLKTINESINVSYAIQYAVDSGDSTITYVGKAVAGSTLSSAVWQINRITDTSGDLSIQFADGDSNFDNIWDDRESLSYS